MSQSTINLIIIRDCLTKMLCQAQLPIRAPGLRRPSEPRAGGAERPVSALRRAEGQRGPAAQVGRGRQPQPQGDRDGRVRVRARGAAGGRAADGRPRQERGGRQPVRAAVRGSQVLDF